MKKNMNEIEMKNQATKVRKAAMPDSYRLLAKGVRVSNNTLKTGKNNHDLIVGGSRAGKTGG